ncbi:MAG: DUF5329 family protein [Dokdonella sp.]
MKCHVAVVTVSLAAGLASGAELSASSRTEIEGLLSALGSSGCAFYRNGEWYDATKAQQHLKAKYDYLLGKGKLSGADDFIVAAATSSSLSGEAYQVRCPHEEVRSSAAWLAEKLRAMRTRKNP